MDKISIIHNDQGIIRYLDNYTHYTLDNIIENIKWRNDPITMFGKTYPQPRLTAWYGDPGITYTYSKITMVAAPWTPILKNIQEELFLNFKLNFNSVMLNYYRDGNDHMSFHSDDEKELGMNPTIASLSFGATRSFHLKHKKNPAKKVEKFELHSQSLLIMEKELQHFWLHKITKSVKIKEPRLNLTFRLILL
jgi:alkylated DNA repair dioxygenase AlkB